MIKRLKLADGRVVRTIRLGLEILLFTALAHAYFYIASERRNRAACCGPGCRTALEGAALHYDRKYFSWQTKLGLEKAQGTDFNKILRVKENETVADLGAGGGHILATLKAKKLVAVELNEYAREQITAVYPEKNIRLHQFTEHIPDNSVDLFYSTSVIEHMECPLTELREVFKKVRPGGRLIVGIKNEGVQYLQQYKTGDTDNHLYTWNALLLGNMVRAAGFRVDEVLPSLEERSQRANEWDTNAVSSYRAFIYHWLHSTKVA